MAKKMQPRWLRNQLIFIPLRSEKGFLQRNLFSVSGKRPRRGVAEVKKAEREALLFFCPLVWKKIPVGFNRRSWRQSGCFVQILITFLEEGFKILDGLAEIRDGCVEVRLHRLHRRIQLDIRRIGGGQLVLPV